MNMNMVKCPVFFLVLLLPVLLRAEENTPNRFKGSDSERIAAAIADSPRFGGLVKIPSRVPDEEADRDYWLIDSAIIVPGNTTVIFENPSSRGRTAPVRRGTANRSIPLSPKGNSRRTAPSERTAQPRASGTAATGGTSGFCSAGSAAFPSGISRSASRTPGRFRSNGVHTAPSPTSRSRLRKTASSTGNR